MKEFYKIGNGPSSSHTMGPQKAAFRFREELEEELKEDVDSIIKETVVLFEEKIRTFNKEWEKIINLMNNKNYLNGKIIKIKTNGNFEDKIYKVSRIERSGKISILGKGDLDEKEFESLEFEVIN